MRHDSRNVSVRDWRAAREGETHSAGRTSNTPESFIVGIGASGGLLAGAAIVFVTLIGVVSFNVWPSAGGISSSGGDVELSAVTPAGGEGEGGATAPLSSASGQLASASVPTGAPDVVGGGGGGNGGGGAGGGNGGAEGELGAGSPPPSGNPPASPPSSGGGSDGPPPGRGEPIDDIKVPSGNDDGRSNKDVPGIDLPGGNGHGKRPGHGNGHHKNPAQPVAPPAVPVPPSDSDDDDESDDDDRDDCRRGRSRGRDRDDDDDESSSPFTSSRSSSHSSGRSRGRGRSRGHRD
jgi:hypothetical protein